MSVSDTFRNLVAARAGGACEYCLLVEAACGVTFHVEHAIPYSHGGPTTLKNLVLSCPGCNLAKADRTVGHDQSGNEQPLFNPRDFEPARLGWHLHFMLTGNSGIITGRSPIGEATVAALDMNSTNRLFARKLQIRVGLIG